MGQADGVDLWQYVPGDLNGSWRIHGGTRPRKLETWAEGGPRERSPTHVRFAGDRDRTFCISGSADFSCSGYLLLGPGAVGVFGARGRDFRSFHYQLRRFIDSNLFDGGDTAGPDAVFYENPR